MDRNQTNTYLKAQIPAKVPLWGALQPDSVEKYWAAAAVVATVAPVFYGVNKASQLAAWQKATMATRSAASIYKTQIDAALAGACKTNSQAWQIALEDFNKGVAFRLPIFAALFIRFNNYFMQGQATAGKGPVVSGDINAGFSTATAQSAINQWAVDTAPSWWDAHVQQIVTVAAVAIVTFGVASAAGVGGGAGGGAAADTAAAAPVTETAAGGSTFGGSTALGTTSLTDSAITTGLSGSVDLTAGGVLGASSMTGAAIDAGLTAAGIGAGSTAAGAGLIAAGTTTVDLSSTTVGTSALNPAVDTLAGGSTASPTFSVSSGNGVLGTDVTTGSGLVDSAINTGLAGVIAPAPTTSKPKPPTAAEQAQAQAQAEAASKQNLVKGIAGVLSLIFLLR